MRAQTVLLLVLTAFVLTIASVAVERVGPTALVEVEGFCPGMEPCRIPALGAGFPLPYLVDNPQISVPNAIGLEDKFRPGAFGADVVFYLTVGAAGVWFWRKRRVAMN